MENERKPIGYIADLGTEWVPLSVLHQKFAERMEDYVSQYLSGNRGTPRIAIVGPYGQGKTQLLFHILKKTLEKGGVPFYTHADLVVKSIEREIGKDQRVIPSDLPKLLHKTVLSDIAAIAGGSFENVVLMHPDVIQWMKIHFSSVEESKGIVLLIDELEQSYENLQDKVDSKDRNPLRGLIDAKEIFTILSFAPRSIYEYKMSAALGEGEAETRRLDIFNLPPVSPVELKTFLKIDNRGFANFIWWLSRGRAGLALKAFNNSGNYSLQEQAGFQSFVESMGQISGVPCLDSDSFMDKEGNFLKNWLQILKIEPSPATSQEDWSLSFSLGKEFDLNAINFFGKLGFSGKHSITLSTFLRLILEAISGANGIAYLGKKDSTPLLRAVYELTLEHTYDEEFISVLQSKLDELQADPNLRYILPDKMEESSLVQRLKTVECLPIDFEKILDCFPFPLSSPQLPGTNDKDVKKWLRGVESNPLAEDSEGSVAILFFSDQDHFKRYCEQSRHSFIEKSLPQKSKTLVIMTSDDVNLNSLPALASCLRKQGRLEIRRLRPLLLTGFVTNALFLLSQSNSGNSLSLRKQLDLLKKQFKDKSDRATVRKIERYSSGLADFLVSSSHNFPLVAKSFSYGRTGAGFEEQFERQKSSPGFFYPFVLAFFKGDAEGGKTLARLRELSERSQDPLQEFLHELGGYRSAVRFLPKSDRKNSFQDSESVSVIRGYYCKLQTDLEELSTLLSIEEFMLLADDELSQFLLKAFYEGKRFKGINTATKDDLHDYLEQSLDIQKRIKSESQVIHESIGVGFEGSLSFSSSQELAIAELQGMLDQIESWSSPVYQEIFAVFAEQICTNIKARADENWKELNRLHQFQYDQLKKLSELFTLPNNLPEDLFKFIGLSRQNFAKALEKMREEAYEKMGNLNVIGLNLQNMNSAHDCFSDLIELHESLNEMKNSFENLKGQLEKYNSIGREK